VGSGGDSAAETAIAQDFCSASQPAAAWQEEWQWDKHRLRRGPGRSCAWMRAKAWRPRGRSQGQVDRDPFLARSRTGLVSVLRVCPLHLALYWQTWRHPSPEEGQNPRLLPGSPYHWIGRRQKLQTAEETDCGPVYTRGREGNRYSRQNWRCSFLNQPAQRLCLWRLSPASWGATRQSWSSFFLPV